MSTQAYVVTLYKKEDLEEFYSFMESQGISLQLKRPLSRNTHYLMTAEQAEEIKQDSRVWDVAPVDSFVVKPQYTPYTISGNFWKDDTVSPTTVSSTDRQWGHLHCAGTDAQRRKGTYGSINTGGSVELVNDSVTVFNNGEDVDVVIVDDPVAYDCEEWYSPSTSTTRFVQYQWFNELNSLVSSIDDDFQTLPTGTITYHTASTIPYYHGNHVTGTVAGQYYGWATEANIYNLAVTGTWSSGQSVGALLIFDYLRAFHANKAVNPSTGRKNPTVTNHSYGGIRDLSGLPSGTLQFTDVSNVIYQGVTYNSGNPGPSGWTQAGLEADFGIQFGSDAHPQWSAAVSADVQDAIDEGIIIIGAAGNDNLLIATPDDDNWNNLISISGIGTLYYNRGAWPTTPDNDGIIVGALSNEADFRRSTYTQYGPGVDIFAPGDNILSVFNSIGGLADSKYSAGSGNYFYPLNGTSMASPQVTGVIACLAANKKRFTNSDVKVYLETTSKRNDMTFDLGTGGLEDPSCQQGSPNKYLLASNGRKTSGYISGWNSTITGRRRLSSSTSDAVQAFPRQNTLKN